MPLTRRGSNVGFLLAFLASAQTVSSLIGAQRNPCDPNLRQLGENPNGYKLRGDRCEGIYVQPVSGSTGLLVASFTEFYEDFDPSTLGKLLVEWSSPAEAPLHLRAYALREKLYYQMDAEISSGKTAYVWPGDLLNALRLSKWDIGVVGSMEYRIGEENRTVYVPLRIRQKNQNPTLSYQLVLVPGSELKEVFISLAQLGTDGQAHSFLISDRPLSKGYYPAERGILVEIPALKKAGVYYLEVGATNRYGGLVTQRMWFYHAGSK